MTIYISTKDNSKTEVALHQQRKNMFPAQNEYNLLT